jgi:hypothetical protein
MPIQYTLFILKKRGRYFIQIFNKKTGERLLFMLNLPHWLGDPWGVYNMEAV